jgi:hypothetical protein
MMAPNESIIQLGGRSLTITMTPGAQQTIAALGPSISPRDTAWLLLLLLQPKQPELSLADVDRIIGDAGGLTAVGTAFRQHGRAIAAAFQPGAAVTQVH